MKKILSKLLSILMIVTCISFNTGMSVYADGTTVTYIGADGNSTTVNDATTLTTESFSSQEYLMHGLSAGTYVVSDNIDASGCDLNLSSGDFNLILCDGAELKVDIIKVESGVTLNIFSQSLGTGKINAKNTGGGGAGIYGTLNVYGGTITAQGSSGFAGIAINTGATLSILGGTVIAKDGGNGFGAFDTREGYAGTIAVKSGSEVYYATNNEGANASSLDISTGTSVLRNSSYKYIKITVPRSVAQIGTNYYSSITEALKHGGSDTNVVPAGENKENPTVIKLLDNTSEDVEIPSGRYITLDLNSHTLTANETYAITNNGTLTINDSSSEKKGTIIVEGDGTYTDYIGIYIKNGSVEINDIAINVSSSSGELNGVYIHEGTLTSNNCIISVENTSDSSYDYAYGINCDDYDVVNNKCYITGGTINVSGSNNSRAVGIENAAFTKLDSVSITATSKNSVSYGINQTYKMEISGNMQVSGGTCDLQVREDYPVVVSSLSNTQKIGVSIVDNDTLLEKPGEFATGTDLTSDFNCFIQENNAYYVKLSDDKKSLTLVDRIIKQPTAQDSSVTVYTDDLSSAVTYQWGKFKEFDLEDCYDEIKFPSFAGIQSSYTTDKKSISGTASENFIYIIQDKSAASIKFKLYNHFSELDSETTGITLDDDDMTADKALELIGVLYENTTPDEDTIIAYAKNSDDSPKYKCVKFDGTNWIEDDTPRTLDELKTNENETYVLGITPVTKNAQVINMADYE